MNAKDKVAQLQQTICSELDELIDRDYWLLEVPYYANIGDTLIWQGERDFLANVPFRCKGEYSLSTFRFPEIPESEMILLQGGGNFGDLWKMSNDFRLEVVKRYKGNKILVFPQTVKFSDDDYLRMTVAVYAAHPDVTICARDHVSYDFLKKYFCNKVLLVPDMGVFLNVAAWAKYMQVPTKRKLLLRGDLEYKQFENIKQLQTDNHVEISDWPTMSSDDRISWCFSYVFMGARYLRTLTDLLVKWIYRRHLIKSGVRFVSEASVLYTTRLHGAILGLVMGHKVCLFDNSYGKNRDFYDTWLKDCDDVVLVA